jgi:hypothetical protein
MERTLREHVTYLEQKIEGLKKELQEQGKSPAGLKEIRHRPRDRGALTGAYYATQT